MPIEVANYISQLEPTNPAPPDLVADSDNHLRMIKQVLRNTFPNLDAPVTATPFQLQSNVPVGGIIMWSGAVVPAGWGLCNGTTYARLDGAGSVVSPNLSNRFIQASDTTNSNVNAVGGSTAKGPVSTTANGAHGHSGLTDGQGSHNHAGVTTSHAITIAEMPSHAHVFTAVVDIGFGNSGRYFPSDNLGSDSRETSYVGGNNGHLHGVYTDGFHAHNVTVYATGDHTHTVTIADIRPLFYTLAFIIKL